MKKESGGPIQLDANVKRSLFARKITSLLKEEQHFSAEHDDEAVKQQSSSCSKTLSSNSADLPSSSFKSDLDQSNLAEDSTAFLPTAVKVKSEWT